MESVYCLYLSININSYLLVNTCISWHGDWWQHYNLLQNSSLIMVHIRQLKPPVCASLYGNQNLYFYWAVGFMFQLQTLIKFIMYNVLHAKFNT